MNSESENVPNAHKEEGDNDSEISPLDCGSIKPIPFFSPTALPNPQELPFRPPVEITINVKQPTPEWLRLEDDDDFSHPLLSSSLQQALVVAAPVSPDLLHSPLKKRHARRRSCCEEVVHASTKKVAPRRHRKTASLTSIGSLLGKFSLRTSPTETSSYLDDSLFLRSPSRSDLKQNLGKLPLFNHHAPDEVVVLQPSQGCLA